MQKNFLPTLSLYSKWKFCSCMCNTWNFLPFFRNCSPLHPPESSESAAAAVVVVEVVQYEKVLRLYGNKKKFFFAASSLFLSLFFHLVVFLSFLLYLSIDEWVLLMLMTGKSFIIFSPTAWIFFLSPLPPPLPSPSLLQE